MSVTLTATTELSPGAWSLSWSSDLPTPTYYLYINEIYAGSTTATQMEFPVGIGESTYIFITDDATETPTPTYPSTIMLQWNAVALAVSYRIDRYEDSAWSQVGLVYGGTLEWFSWTSEPLTDATTYIHRVVPITAGGIEGTAIQITTLMVTLPPVPSVAYYFNDTDKKLYVGFPPAITVHPVSLTKVEGQSATFEVTATGTSIGYQWQKNGANLTGKTTYQLVINPTAMSDAGLYSCVVSSVYGTATSNQAFLDITEAP